jgi:hypothetical protein
VRSIRKQAQVEAFKIARLNRAADIVEIKLEDDPRSRIFASGFDGWIRLPANTWVEEGDYLIHENGCSDFVVSRIRFEWEYSVIGDGSTHSDESLFPPIRNSES